MENCSTAPGSQGQPKAICHSEMPGHIPLLYYSSCFTLPGYDFYTVRKSSIESVSLRIFLKKLLCILVTYSAFFKKMERDAVFHKLSIFLQVYKGHGVH